MVAMRVLTVLLGVLFVANAQGPREENVSGQPRYPSTTGRPQYQTTTGRPQYQTTTGRPQYQTTTDESRYPYTTDESRYPYTTDESRYPYTTDESRYPYTTDESRYPYTTDESRYPYTTDESRYPSTTDESRYPYTTEEPQYPSQYRTTSDYFWNDTFTDAYNPQILTAQCGISQDTVFYLDAFENSEATFEISSNTSENTAYSNNVDCSVQFITGADPVGLSVVIEGLDLENNTACSFDYLCIKGAKFCGKATYSNYQYYVVPSNNTFTIKFHTDGSVTASGFRVIVYSWRITSDVSSYEPYGIISNPNYIANYHEVNQSNYVDSCNNEYDQVYHSTYPSYDLFTSDYYTTRRPYVLTAQCGISQDTVFYLDGFENSEATFEISSNTSENTAYSNNVDCSVQFITGADSVGLSVVIEGLDLENDTACSFDYLCIKGAKFCGRSTYSNYQYYVVPSNNTFTIKFHTDGSVTASGFKVQVSSWRTTSNYSYEPYGIISNPNYIANYHEVNQSNYVDSCNNDQVYHSTYPSYGLFTSDYYTTDRPNSGDEQVIECNSGDTDNYYYLDSYSNNRYILRSDNFGNGSYGANSNCKVKFFTSSVRQSLSVYYSSFDLESTRDCAYDSLCVNGVKYCSNWLQGLTNYYEIPSYSSFSVNFVTDGSVSRSGFEAHFTFANANYASGRYEATSGDGSSSDTVVYSYAEDYSYRDRCASDYSSQPTSYYDVPSTTSEPEINFGDSAILQSYVRVIKSNVDEAATRLGVVQDLINSLPSEE